MGGSFDVATAGHTFHRPEAADAESAFSGWEPVVGPRLVAVDQLASSELLVDAGAGGAHPRVCAFDVAVERQGQQARVHLFAVEGARVTPYPLVVPMSLDLLPDLVPLLAEEVSRYSDSCISMRRSSATQHKTFEWVLWNRPERPSQMPSSGSRQRLHTVRPRPSSIRLVSRSKRPPRSRNRVVPLMTSP